MYVCTLDECTVDFASLGTRVEFCIEAYIKSFVSDRHTKPRQWKLLWRVSRGFNFAWRKMAK